MAPYPKKENLAEIPKSLRDVAHIEAGRRTDPHEQTNGRLFALSRPETAVSSSTYPQNKKIG